MPWYYNPFTETLDFYVTAAPVGSDVLVAIDAGAAAGYLGSASGDGVFRSDSTIDYDDGGDYITVGLSSALKAEYDAAYSHVSNDGSDHSLVNSNRDHATGTGADHSLVVTNNDHATGDGEDHSTVVTNNDHVTGDGLDHSAVVTANDHITADGSSHSFIDQSVTTSASVEFVEVGITTQAYFDAEYDNGSASAIDWSLGNKQRTELMGALTATFTDPSGACNLIWKIVQDGTGNRALSLPSAVRYGGGVYPTAASAASAQSIFSLYFDGSDYYCLGTTAFATAVT